MQKVVETVRSMNRSLGLYCGTTEGNANIVFKETKKLATEVSETKEEIMRRLEENSCQASFEERTMSDIEEEIIRLIFTSENISENAKAATVKLVYLQDYNPEEGLKNNLFTLSNKAVKVVSTLQEAFSELLHENIEDAIEKSRRVSRLKKDASNFRQTNLTPQILEWSKRATPPGIVGIFTDVVNNIEKVINKAENAANIIRRIAIEET